MLRLIEVASQSETFSKRGLRKAKTNTVNSIIEWMAQPGHYRVVFFLYRPPLLAVWPHTTVLPGQTLAWKPSQHRCSSKHNNKRWPSGDVLPHHARQSVPAPLVI